MPGPFAIPNDPRVAETNANIIKLVAIRSEAERNLNVVAIRSPFLENDPDYIAALALEAKSKKNLQYINDVLFLLENNT